MLGDDGSLNGHERSFGNVSVVHIAVAAESQESWVDVRVVYAVGILWRIL